MSNRCYWIVWKDGRPQVEPGILVLMGKKTKCSRAQMPSSTKLVHPREVSLTIKEAIAKELDHAARRNASNEARHREANPWSLVKEVTRLWRLYHTMRRHHLVSP